MWSQNILSCCSDITSYRIRTFLNSPLGSDRLASIVDTALWNSEAMTRAALVNLQSYAEFSGTQFDPSIRKKVDGENQDAESVSELTRLRWPSSSCGPFSEAFIE